MFGTGCRIKRERKCSRGFSINITQKMKKNKKKIEEKNKKTEKIWKIEREGESKKRGEGEGCKKSVFLTGNSFSFQIIKTIQRETRIERERKERQREENVEAEEK